VNGSSAPVYNTLTTPRGGMYRLVLSDGTLAILNAASSILYPTVFTGKERSVTVRGEVYFEVKHNAAMPFKVKSGSQTIEVLGTHFNVNAYDEVNHIKTTLLQGAVRVTSGSVSKYLVPGEQSDFSHNEIKVLKIDAEDAIAWKNGFFTFEDESLENIMRNISRWYDVEVSYQDVDRSMPFGGGVSRFEDVSKVLEKLELTGKIHFKIEGRRILVTK
jgi:ferric-dicitrate binding protein FerR (iron transport regulator)